MAYVKDDSELYATSSEPGLPVRTGSEAVTSGTAGPGMFGGVASTLEPTVVEPPTTPAADNATVAPVAPTGVQPSPAPSAALDMPAVAGPAMMPATNVAQTPTSPMPMQQPQGQAPQLSDPATVQAITAALMQLQQRR